MFANLKKLKLFGCVDNDKVYDILMNLMEQKKRLERSNVKTFCKDIELLDEMNLREFDFKRQNLLSLQMNNYKLLTHTISTTFIIGYTELMSLTNNQIPIDFASMHHWISLFF